MIPRDAPLSIPSRPNWFAVDLGDRGVHHFRVPRASVRLALASALRGTSSVTVGLTGPQIAKGLRDGVTELDAATTTVLRASGETAGACIGECWRHRTLALETVRQRYPGDEAGLRQFGDTVMDELEDADYTADELKAITEAIVPRILEGLAPALKEVAAHAASFPG